MAFDQTWDFSTKAECNDGDWLWTGSVNGDHDIQDENTATYWCWTDSGSTSSSTGPPSGTECVYPETSSPTAVSDTHTAQMEAAAEVDASLYSLNVTVDTCMQGDAAGEMVMEAWDGTTWNEIDSWNGDTTTTFTSQGPYDFGPDDLDYDNDDFKLRFTVTVGGTTYHNDFSFTNVRIYGEDKVTKGAGMLLASAEDLQGTAAAENPGTFGFDESLPWGAITLALRQAPAPDMELNFDNVQVSGEIENTSTGTLDINATNGSSYGTLNNEGDGAGQENWVSSTSLTISGLPANTELTIVNASTRAELFHVENTSGATEVYSYGSSEVGTVVDILVLHLDYLPEVGPIFDYTLTSSDSTIPIAMIEDVTYKNT